MMKHLSDEELNDHLDTTDRTLEDRVRGHVATCAECAARLTALRNVVAHLADAPREAELPRDLWDDIGPRLTASLPAHSKATLLPLLDRRARAFAWKLAAAVVIFAAGLLAGTRLSSARASASRGDQSIVATSDSANVAAEVQAAGTRYAVAIARLADIQGTSTFDQGREAAIASLYTASRALAEVSPTDDDALAILYTVSRSHVNRIHEASSRARTIVRF